MFKPRAPLLFQIPCFPFYQRKDEFNSLAGLLSCIVFVNVWAICGKACALSGLGVLFVSNL